MKRITLTIMAALLAAAITVHAITWQKTFEGGNGYCVQETLDSNYIISASKDTDLWLFKTDTFGNVIWEKFYEGSQGKWVEQTSDGGYIVASRYPTLLKADENGDTIWTGDFGMYSYCVQETSDSGYIVVCGDNGNGGDTYLGLVKTDTDGNAIWTRTYTEPGRDFNTGFFVQQTLDSGYIITGKTDSVVGSEGEFVTEHLWLMKTDADGSVQWTKKYGTGANYEFNIGRCVRQTSEGYYIISGEKGFSPGGFWLLKANEYGDTLWTRSYGGEYGGCVIETSDGNYAAVGRGPAASIWESSLPNGGDVLLVKVDPDGNTIWSQNYGGDDVDVGDCLSQTSDGGYIITGWSGSFVPSGLYLLKTDSLGFIEAVAEEPVAELPITWKVLSPVGASIVLQYFNRLQGLQASVFDVTGRKIARIHVLGSSGSVTWGINQVPGVYFVQVKETNQTRTEKVVIIH